MAWEKGPAFRDTLFRVLRKALAEGAPTRSWIASIDDEPVATAHMRFMAECGYLQGCAVVPSQRRRGLYGALVNHRLAVLREAGVRTAVIFAAAETSGRACEQMGFETICTAEFFQRTHI